MPSKPPLELALGDRVRLRKPHPCGGYEWTVIRLGADIGLKCDSCGRYVMIPRRELEKRIKAKIPHQTPHPNSSSQP